MKPCQKKAAISQCISNFANEVGCSVQEAEYEFNEKMCKKQRSKLIKRAHRSLK